MRKPSILIIVFFFFSLGLSAQEQQKVQLSSQQIETLFLRENLQIIAESMNIDMAEAEIAQARLWDNPELSISSVNLWSSKKQREEVDMNRFPKNTQFSVELSQLIQIAKKRGKQVRKEKISKEITTQDFQELLKSLKLELRQSICEMYYLQSYLHVLTIQDEALDKLIGTYKRQVTQGNIAKVELLRLQSSQLDLESEINEVKTELNSQQKNIKVLINASPNIQIEIAAVDNSNPSPNEISLSKLLEMAYESRPNIKRQQLQSQYHEMSIAYEKAARMSDLSFSVNYDRYGGVWKDFIGFGVSFDLPFLNRNQGNIKLARINYTQSLHLEQWEQNLAQHEISEGLLNYTEAYNFYKKLSENELLSELDDMLGVYTKNLLNKNISMLEYIDFMDAYRSNKQAILTAYKKLNTSFEELQFVTGTDIK